jgi:hypothetical protein
VTAPRKPPARRRARRNVSPEAHRFTLKTIVQGVTGAVALAGAITGLVFAFWPSIRPSAPPAEKSATLDQLAADEVITRRQYFDRAQLPSTGFQPKQLARRGLYVTFDLAIDGYKGKKLPLRWELVNATTGNQTADSESTLFKPLADSDKASWQEWIPLPSGRHRYVVYVRLYDPTARVPLASQRSAPISVEIAG